ncbi:MAG: ATP-binding protein, partial [Rhodospirillales bacterium]
HGDAALRDDLTLLGIDDGQGLAKRAAAKKKKGRTKAAKARADAGGETLLTLRVPSQPDRLKLIRNAVAEAARFCGCEDDLSRDIVIAVDEACQNVIRHAYGGAADGEIALEIRREGDELIILLRDFAETIDTDKVRPRDLGDLRPGGLGTHFMREVMDDVRFMPPPADGGNLLRMVKRLS